MSMMYRLGGLTSRQWALFLVSSALAGVLVGDTPLDVEAALATGARAVGVATGGPAAAELVAAGADAVLPDLTDTAAVVAAITGAAAPAR